ncbi:hypothetical protein B6S59_25485 [Pseudomonas sp. A46]|nr:hypothetical protein [Pseudomonas sp. A46]OWJ91126.1 hypothetical protein B6S59_25485 [Pseudomonas sp. A46]
MAKKISELDAASVPLVGSEQLEIVQGGQSKRVAASDLLFGGHVDVPTTSRTLALTDAGAYLRHTNAATSTVTVPLQSSVAWLSNTEITIRRAAGANLALTAEAGVTLNAPSGGTLVMTNGMTVTLKRVDVDIWDVIGQTVAA